MGQASFRLDSWPAIVKVVSAVVDLAATARETKAFVRPRKVRSAEEIEMGKHGVVVTDGLRLGVFLPQVAREQHWSRSEFLDHLCADKAGLAPDAWRHGASLSIFTVQAFQSPAPRN